MRKANRVDPGSPEDKTIVQQYEIFIPLGTLARVISDIRTRSETPSITIPRGNTECPDRQSPVENER